MLPPVHTASGSDGRRAGNGSRRRARRLQASTAAAAAAAVSGALPGEDAELADHETLRATNVHPESGKTEQVWWFERHRCKCLAIAVFSVA